MSRISIHMLISHFNALQGQSTTTVTGMVGTINQHCNILEVASNAYNSASILCDGEYYDHPKLVIYAEDVTDNDENTKKVVSASYVPAHLHHILFEIFKNSMRATCEFTEERNLPKLPPITCKIFKTKED